MSACIKIKPVLCLGSTLVLLPLLVGHGCVDNGNDNPIPILETWTQFQSGINGEGFLAVDTELAVPPLVKWEVEVDRVGYGSPVIGPDGTIYVGTLDGVLVAITPDGRERWRRTFFDNSTIVSTPAVAADGSIFVVVTHPSGSDLVSDLNRVSPNGVWQWNSPALQEGKSTTSSPRVFGEFVFLYVFPEVAVYDFDGNIVSRSSATSCTAICGNSPLDFIGDLLSSFGNGLLECTLLLPVDSADCWDNFVFEFDGSTKRLPPLDPTVAIISSKNVVGEGGPVVVALNGFCMTGFRFNAPNLERLWVRRVYGGGCGDDPVNHGSPAVVGGGLLVIANENGEVTGHDPLNGRELWKYEAEESFLSTPASFVRPIFVTSSEHVHLLSDNGQLITKRKLFGWTQASFALSANHAYVSTSAGLFTFDFALSSSFTVDGAGLSYISTPAIGDDGTVYAATNEGTIRAYSPAVGSLQFNFQTAAFNEPGDGAALPAGVDTAFSAEVSSASSGGFDGEITFSSDIDGDLCVAEGIGPDFSCEGQLTTLGEHVITVAALDASGTLATDSITVEVIEDNPVEVIDVDAPPTVGILAPENGAVFRTDEVIAFVGNVNDPNETIPPASISWTSDADGLLGTGESISITLSQGTHIVTLAAIDSGGLRGEDSVTIQVIAGMPPTVDIVQPGDGSSFLVSDSVGFQAQASDPQDGTLSGNSLVWVSDIDGLLGTGESLSVALSQGTHTVVVTATNSLQLSATDSVTVTVAAGPGVPTVTVSSPANSSAFAPAQTITFVGSATDPEDGSLPDSSFRWTSDIDGFLGTGRTLPTTLSGELDPCNTRTHVITLEVTDSDGNTTSQEISVRIKIVC